MNSNEIIKGTYKPDDVTLLLKDVTDLVTPVTTEEKERLIQSGTHYSELLQKEWEPSDDYLEFYRKTLDHFSPVISPTCGDSLCRDHKRQMGEHSAGKFSKGRHSNRNSH